MSQDLYPGAKCFKVQDDYKPMINVLGDVLVDATRWNYHYNNGWIWVLISKAGSIGILIDEEVRTDLGCCNSYEDVQEIFESLRQRILWFETTAEITDYLNSYTPVCERDQIEIDEFISLCREKLLSRFVSFCEERRNFEEEEFAKQYAEDQTACSLKGK